MGRARDVINEIAEVRQRRRFGSALAELPMRLMALESAFRSYDQSQIELVRYFPVALIACVEGYFRLAIKDLIDSGEPYLTNAEKATTNLKLDFALLRAVHGKAVTVGELIAHGVQLSRLEHIEGVLSSLLDRSFLVALRTTTDRWAHEVKGEPATPILANPDAVFADVARTFELRHIICHEIASAYEIRFAEVARCFESCVAFLRAADELISETIHPGAPLTQTGMNIAAGKSLDEKRKAMAEAIEALRVLFSPNETAAFEESQEKWRLYCESWADFIAGERKSGGTIWPLIYASTMEEMVEKRIEEIKGFKRLSDPV